MTKLIDKKLNLKKLTSVNDVNFLFNCVTFACLELVNFGKIK